MRNAPPSTPTTSTGNGRDIAERLPLRELKKHRTAQVLRAKARDYFKRVPFDNAKLTDIARDAEVSATTVYAYFPTKLKLLYAVVGEENIETVEKARRLNTRSWNDAAEAFHAFARLFFRWFDSYHRSALRALLTSALAPRTEAHTEYSSIDELEASALADLVEALQQQRLVDPTLDARFLGRLLFNLMNAQFVAFVGDEALTVEEACASLRAQIQFIAPTWVPGRTREKENLERRAKRAPNSNLKTRSHA